MANILTSNPLYIDTAASSLIIPANQVLNVTAIMWNGYTDATHQVVVKNGAGTEIANSLGHTDKSSVDLVGGNGAKLIYGLIVSTLGSGHVQVFCE